MVFSDTNGFTIMLVAGMADRAQLNCRCTAADMLNLVKCRDGRSESPSILPNRGAQRRQGKSAQLVLRSSLPCGSVAASLGNGTAEWPIRGSDNRMARVTVEDCI